MDTIYDATYRDITSIRAISRAIETASSFSKESPAEMVSGDDDKGKIGANEAFLEKALAIKGAFRDAHIAMPMLRGSLLLSMLSRFEAFIKAEIEELAIQATQKVSGFSKLPNAMQENLRRLSGEVIANPRKYRMHHRVGEIAKNLTANWGDEDDATRISYFCLSITNENLRAESLAEMFKRLGIKDYWERIAKYPDLLIFFNTSDENFARSEAQKKIDQLIELRNKITHNPETAIWPSQADVEDAIEFILILAKATSLTLPVFALSFCRENSH